MERKTNRTFTQLILTSFLALFMAGCTGGESASDIFGVKTAPDVNINLMAVVPSNKFLFISESIQFSATGGSAPYTYTLDSGVGSVTSTGFYTAPAFAGTAVVKATDSKGEEAFATVSISIPIAISPTSSTIGEGDTIAFSATGGLPPFTYRIVAGLGAINSSTGLYDATGVTNGSSVVEVKDSSENTAYASVTINPALVVVPQVATIGFSEQINFSTSGGNSPYTYAIISGGGTINASSGVFVGPATVGTTIVRVTDSSSNTVDSVITIVDKPQLNNPQTKIATGASVTFSATNGAPPYSYSIVSGGGSIVAGTGVFTAPATTGSVVIQVTDFNSNTDSVTVEIFKPKFVAMGYYHTCALNFSDTTTSVTKCWGRANLDGGARGMTGEDKAHVIMDESDEVQDYAPTIDLGTGIQAKYVKNGYYSTCAVTTTNQLKCFGYNNYGNLGLGDRVNYGVKAGQMGDDLTAVDLGTGRTVNSTLPIEDILAVRYHSTCVILDNNNLRCWGYNAYGKLGHGNSASIGDSPAETGDSYPVVDFGGTGVTAVANGYFHTCAILNTGDLKCWGRGNFGQTGRESTATTGHSAGTKPVSLAAVNLGTGRTAQKVCAGSYHTCAILDTGDVKCFGYNNRGQLGQERTGNYGDGASEMGDNLPITQLGTGRTATEIACAYESTCAVLDNGDVKCWGYNARGELGVGNTTQKGLNVGDMGDSLDPVVLGTGLTATKVIAGGYQFCAKLNTGAYKCWGDNPYATLAQGHTYDIGKSLLSMGNNLDPISISSTNAVTQLSVEHLTGCAVLDNNELKCWGLNYYGSRGGGQRVKGDEAGEMGSNLAAQNLGSNPSFKEIKSEVYTTCARNTSDNLFCFGQGSEGALGSGSTASAGDKASEWGDSMSFIDFGAVDTVSDFAVGYRGGCALLTDNTVKCWGSSDYGATGRGNTNDIDAASEVGTNMPTVDLGNTSTPVQLAAGYQHRCARFTNGGIKCWGRNSQGQLGLGISTGTHKGDHGGEMGNSLPYLSLGTGINATQVTAGIYHTCALFDNGGVKCWGDRYRTGFGATSHVGDSAAEMGDNLPFLDFGTGRTAQKISCGGYHCCAILDNNDLKCWGENGYGELGIGSVNDIGDVAGEMGDSHDAVNLGTGRYAVDVFTSLNQTCAVLDNNDLKCWGRNANGQLGQGHTTDIGEISITLGDNLPAVEVE